MVGTPMARPATIPVVEPTDPRAGLLLLHVPPLVASDNVVVKPTHTNGEPEIPAGVGLTVNGVVTRQPVGNV